MCLWYKLSKSVESLCIWRRQTCPINFLINNKKRIIKSIETILYKYQNFKPKLAFLSRSWLGLLEIFIKLLPFYLLFVFTRLLDGFLMNPAFFKSLLLALNLFFSYYGNPFLIQLWLSAYTGEILSYGSHFKKD